MLIANQHNTEEEEPMAQLNITLNREEIQELLSENSSAAFKKKAGGGGKQHFAGGIGRAVERGAVSTVG